MNSPLGLGLGMAIPQLLNQASAGMSANAGGSAFASNANTAPANAATAGHLSSGAAGGSAKLDFSSARVPAKTDLQAAIKSLGESLGWSIQQLESNRLTIAVSLSSSRRQRVYVELDKTDDHGNPVVGIWSPCGAINPASALTVLRNNDSVVHGAFAMKRMDSGEVLVLKSNVLASLTNTAELAKLISSIAWQADEVEQQLSGGEDAL